MCGDSASSDVVADSWVTAGDLDAQIRETYTGVVVLVADKAFKAKKPIKTDFLDFSTPERREHACQREVRLNRRLAPDSYFGVAHLSDVKGGAAEPVVVMRRYPDDARLTSLIKNREPVHQHLCVIAEMLARFHETAVRGGPIEAEGKAGAVAARWQQNLIELQRLSDAIISPESIREMARLASQFISGRAELFAERITDGRIVDGHADLLTDDIFCMRDGPALLDCLEFDDHLRYVDGIDDAAFLAMDLEFHGRGDLAGYFLDEYCRRAGDAAPQALKDFYIAYRAAVRAKVDCGRVTQGHPDAAGDAGRHTDIALEHLRAGTVRLIIIGGDPGTGKTTLSLTLAEQTGAQAISTDKVRRQLQQEGAISGGIGDLDAGLYAPENVTKVYDEVLRRARLLLSAGVSVILDGTWRDAYQRQRARTMAEQTRTPLVEFTCSVSLAEAAARIVERPASSSDATPQIAAALAGRDTERAEGHPIDTSRPLAESVAEAQQICRLAT